MRTTIKLLLAIGDTDIEQLIYEMKNIEVVEKSTDIEIISDVIEFIEADFVIVNTILSIEKSRILAEAAKINDLKVIAIVADLNDKELIASLIGYGVYAFVPINELYKIAQYIMNYPATFDFNLINNNKNQKEKKKQMTLVDAKKSKKKTIAVIGSMNRIGTTTQAIQLVKFLNENGFKACYVEANKSGYTEGLENIYSVEANEEYGFVRCKGIDLYYKSSQVNVLGINYDYYVYDFGNIQNIKPEDDISFLEKDIKILVCGTKSNEIISMRDAFSRVKEQETKYIYSFSITTEHNIIKKSMKDYVDSTYFADYTPDPFESNCSYLYADLLDLRDKIGNEIVVVKKQLVLKSVLLGVAIILPLAFWFIF